MTTVICEKSGLVFEAKTARTKNHPAIMAIINEANKDGWYCECLCALQEHKGKLATIEEYVALLEEVKVAAENAQMAAWRAKKAQERAEKEARRERYETSARLRAHGYHWSKEIVGGDDEEYEYGFMLLAPDGGEVSVSQALAEIENPALVAERLAQTTITQESTVEAETAKEPELDWRQERYNARREIELAEIEAHKDEMSEDELLLARIFAGADKYL